MSTSAPMPLYLAESAALELQRILQPVCERVAVAGSVRRHKNVCNDVEIVAIPRIDQAVRPGELLPSDVDQLEQLCTLITRGDHPVLQRPKAKHGHRAPPWGPRQKKLWMRHQQRWVPVDLWITTRQRWGAIYAIRTGDAEFSHLLVTQRALGGGMPANMCQREGSLQHIVGRTDDGKPEWQPLYTPEEADFFEALGLPVLNPEQRTVMRLRHLLQTRQPAAST